MLGVFALAAVCAAQPFFPATPGGPVCTSSAQTVECQCSECMCWDPVSLVASNSPTYYEITRDDPDGSSGNVGTIRRQVAVDESTGTETYSIERCWCFAKDSAMPHEGQLYQYRVRACNAVGCSQWSPAVSYRVAPYAVNQFRPPVVGNP